MMRPTDYTAHPFGLFILHITLLALCSSCVKYKKLVYLNEEDTGSYPKPVFPEYEIRPYDILSIDLKSLEQGATTYFNETTLQQNRPGGGGGQANPALFYVNGYIVTPEGNVNLPLVGEVSVAGLTTDAIEEKVSSALSSYIKFTSISVKLVNFKVSVMGEVGSPGTQYVYEKQLNLLQAISRAGDLTEFGDRSRVKLVRETADSVSTSYIDLRDPRLLSSNEYFLQPNDLIYVEPTRAKVFGINTRVPAFTLSLLTVGLTIVNFILNSQ